MGNINRSAAAEIMCKQLTSHEVKSCGLNGVEGKNITGKMRKVLTQMGYDVPIKKLSVGLTTDHLLWADKIYCMDSANDKRLRNGFPEFCKCNPMITVIGAKDPHFQKGEEHHFIAANIIENFIKHNLSCAE